MKSINEVHEFGRWIIAFIIFAALLVMTLGFNEPTPSKRLKRICAEAGGKLLNTGTEVICVRPLSNY